MSSARGFSVLEVITAIGISVPLLVAFMLSLRSESETFRIIRRLDARESGFFRIEGLLQRSVSDSETSSWAPLFRIHKNGRIRFVDGSPNPIMTPALSRQPLRQADAITSAAVDTEHAFVIRSTQVQGSLLIAKACPRHLNSGTPRQAHSILALSVDGSFELVPSQKKITLGSSCQTFRLRATKSMLTATASLLDLHLVQILVPLIEPRTLYLDRQNQLRYLAHRGSGNLENQPVLTGLKELRLSMRLLGSWQIPALEGKVSSIHDEVQEFSFVGSFGRGATYNFLLNRP